jgi:hypothetical protein
LGHDVDTGTDPQVSVAFALGWQMAELYRPQLSRRRTAFDGDLPGISALSDDVRLEILVDQVEVGIGQLSAAIKQAGLQPLRVTEVRSSLRGERLQEAVSVLHVDTLGTLTATDFRFGTAYGLGRALADTCRNPTDFASLQTQFGEYRIANLRQWLDDLSTPLPDHAAHSVSESLRRWVVWALDPAAAAEPDAIAQARRQGELWRALLSGEKRGTELLELDNYLDASRAAADQMASIARRALARFPVVIGFVVALVVVGIVLLGSGGGSHDVAGVGSLLAAVGLSWKTLGTAAGQLAGKLEQPVWGAVIDLAIADAITLLPGNDHDHAARRALAIVAESPETPDAGHRPAA